MRAASQATGSRRHYAGPGELGSCRSSFLIAAAEGCHHLVVSPQSGSEAPQLSSLAKIAVCSGPYKSKAAPVVPGPSASPISKAVQPEPLVSHRATGWSDPTRAQRSEAQS